MRYLHTNNASSNLRFAIAVGATSIVVTSGHGTLFPLPGVDDGFFVTVEDRRSGRLEIMLCTSRTGDTLTVTRGQQGTIPQSFVIGVNVSNRVTAQILNEFVSATVDVVPPARIPPITSAMIVNLDASKLVGPGKVPVGVLPPITSAMITSLDAAKLTGVIHPDRITSVPAVALPNIPSVKLTAVPAENLTGTINMARIASSAITDVKIADLNAAKLTGTINAARLPTTFSITGAVTVGSLSVTGNVSIGGAITGVDSVVAAGQVRASLVHEVNRGYVYVGVFSAAHGTGHGRIYYDSTLPGYVFLSTSGAAEIHAGNFIGSGAGLTGVPTSALSGPYNGIGMTAMLRYEGGSVISPGGNVNAGTSGATLKYANAVGQASASVYPPNGSLWEALGVANGPGNSAEKTTLWRRLS